MSTPTRGSIEDREFEAFEEISGRIYKAAVVFPPGGGTTFNVSLTESDTEVVVNYPDEIFAVPSATESTILTVTVPVGFNIFLQFVEVDGTNIADYRVYRDASILGKKRTWWTSLTDKLDFVDSKMRGLKILENEVITVKVEHSRPIVGDFRARLVGVMVPV